MRGTRRSPLPPSRPTQPYSPPADPPTFFDDLNSQFLQENHSWVGRDTSDNANHQNGCNDDASDGDHGNSSYSQNDKESDDEEEEDEQHQHDTDGACQLTSLPLLFHICAPCPLSISCVQVYLNYVSPKISLSISELPNLKMTLETMKYLIKYDIPPLRLNN